MGSVAPDQNVPEAQMLAQAAPRRGGKCGGLGRILVIIVAVAVTLLVTKNLDLALKAGKAVLGFTGTAGAVAAGVVAGAAGSVASQAVGIAIGVQDKFSFKGVALSAIAGGIGGGIGALSGPGGAVGAGGQVSKAGLLSNAKLGAFGGGVVRGALGNVATQGIAVAAGLQKRFDWTGVAVGGIVGGATSWTGAKLPGADAGAWTRAGITHAALSGTAGAIAGAGARSLLTGTSFGDNLRAVLPDVIGSTIGNAIAGGIQARQQAAQERASAERIRSSFDANGNPLYPVAEPISVEKFELKPVMAIPDNLITMNSGTG